MNLCTFAHHFLRALRASARLGRVKNTAHFRRVLRGAALWALAACEMARSISRN